MKRVYATNNLKEFANKTVKNTNFIRFLILYVTHD